ncbi:hypothetical protein, partial [Viscerimonas tarda]
MSVELERINPGDSANAVADIVYDNDNALLTEISEKADKTNQSGDEVVYAPNGVVEAPEDVLTEENIAGKVEGIAYKTGDAP